VRFAAIAILTAFVLAVLWAFPEVSHSAPYPKLTQAIAVADAHWPDSPCKGREIVLPADAALSVRYGAGETAAAFSDPYLCRVWVRYDLLPTRVPTWQLRCRLLEHEFGHLAGWRSTTGQYHSDNIRSVMYPILQNDYHNSLDCWHAFPEHYANFT